MSTLIRNSLRKSHELTSGVTNRPPPQEFARVMTDRIDAIAALMLDTLDGRRQMAPMAASEQGFELDDAYRVTARVTDMRRARGETPIGRKLGFTNRTIWDEYNVYAPIWGYVYDTTVREINPAAAAFDLARVVEPRIEPEITLSLKRAPEVGMDERALLGCVDWVAHGFEIVQSLFPGWRFTAPDTVAAFGLHGALLLGPRHAITPENFETWLAELSSFEVALYRGGEEIDRGHAHNVLGGPLSALKNVVEVLARDRHNPPLAAGEFITTGTVTRAFPAARGETWRSEFSGAPFEGITLTFT